MRYSNNIYEYDGKCFRSIKQLSQYVGINEKTLTARLRKGLSVKQACDNKDLRCRYFEDNEHEKSIEEICKEQSKDSSLVRNRLRYGYSMNDALNKPKKVSKQGIPIVVNGKLYNSISAALKQLGLLSKESTVRRRLREGMKPDDAFSFDK